MAPKGNNLSGKRTEYTQGLVFERALAFLVFSEVKSV
jgi:hypothetical protein